MKKLFLLAATIIILSVNSFCQSDSYIKNRWNIKAGYARYITGNRSNNKNETTGNLRLECNYGILNFIESGLYIGFSNFDFIINTDFDHKKYFTPFYGININVHLLPLIVKSNDFRFDLYLAGKFGGRYFTTPDNYYIHGHYNEYGLGSGISFYFWDQFGIYAEYCFGKYQFRDAIKDNAKLRYGVTFKF